MRSFLIFSLGFLLGLVAGPAFSRWRTRQRDGTVAEAGSVLPPLTQQEFEKRLEYIDRRYHEAMAQYDKLVPWAAGGGLVVSLTFVASLARVVPPWSKLILASAWAALVFALLCSILSQYYSTRIQVWAKRHLYARQNPPGEMANATALDEWRRKTVEFKRKSDRSGHRTKWLNVGAVILLIAGLVLLGLFAVLAVPFGRAVQPQ